MSNLPQTARKTRHPLLKISLLTVGTIAFLKLLQGRQAVDFRGRVVAITGGSRGLGLNLARQLASQGAKIALIARDVQELATAEREILALGAQCFTVSADIGIESEAEGAIERIAAHFGHLDALVNGAGIMQIGPLDNMAQSDFEAAMNINFWGGLWCARAAMPHLKKSGQGRIANIVSFGGQVAAPHMAPYTASKFAMKGFSDALRNEAARDGVLVTTVCPGPIRSGSHLQIKFKGQQAKEFRLLKMAIAIPGGAIEVESAARLIIEAMKKGVPSLIFPFPVFLLTAAYAVFPNLAGAILSLVTRFAPAPDSANGDELIAGRDLQSEVPPSVLTRLADRAVEANNEGK